MKLTKGKRYFWSQLLFSMIAMFALPQVQQWQHAEANNPTYQNQSVQRQIACVAQNLQQKQAQQQFWAVSPIESQKLLEFRPHFSGAVFTFHAPIRGSPRI
ncbi:hypothetical protein CBG46_05930 [Actinobacillus succinogenes]|uniref:DUF2547 family protein n=1 Tax=Actinobacillus succinogenes (strain ATCC 55618 / DSM 22257 / CCUG 43843 / 130Z) TaxID=339671 RepID=A6VQX1_ACTSZ|nr:secA translation cis-regulator SecM [Actinobacillus succinogenes]ABR75368.1 conserved hypothetical protein [Actinobacillus succinogenes 130Z]PHI40243.1 hypothetical protein CBG46_05930 [Actinobacillus succinogenes]